VRYVPHLAFDPKVAQKIRNKETLTVPESLSVLAEGYRKFQERSLPSSLGGVSFIRIAGQAAGLDNEESRSEIRRILKETKPGGAFLVLGHGGIIPCGGVGAKQKEIELARQGKELDEPGTVKGLMKNICPDVAGKATPQAELVNAIFQARKILDDPEFGEIIKKKNISVIVGICSENPMEYIAINREGTPAKSFIGTPNSSPLARSSARAFARCSLTGLTSASTMRTRYSFTTRCA